MKRELIVSGLSNNYQLSLRTDRRGVSSCILSVVEKIAVVALTPHSLECLQTGAGCQDYCLWSVGFR